MKLNEVRQKVYDILQPYQTDYIPVKPNSFTIIDINELLEFYEFLQNPHIHKNSLNRPPCPLKRERKGQSMGRYHPSKDYKTKMTEYIATWGFKFKMPSLISPCVLESTANYLESKALTP